jgi:chemotaxis protein CheD
MMQQIRPLSLPMGEIAVARSSGVLRTLLGSCLGLALYDRRFKVGGLGHIVLPSSQGRAEHPGNLPGKFADTAVPAIIRQMQELACEERLKLCAKIAGGANMFTSVDSSNTIGMQNVQAIERLLDNLGIPIIGRHCGGEQGRRMMLDTATGIVTIDIVGAETTSL